jgi:hypothetical protein
VLTAAIDAADASGRIPANGKYDPESGVVDSSVAGVRAMLWRVR